MARSVPGAVAPSHEEVTTQTTDTAIVVDPRATPADLARSGHEATVKLQGNAPDPAAPIVADETFVVQKDIHVVFNGVRVLMPAGKEVTNTTYDVPALRLMGVSLKSRRQLEMEEIQAQRREQAAIAELKAGG